MVVCLTMDICFLGWKSLMILVVTVVVIPVEQNVYVDMHGLWCRL